ncbi:MAG: glycosyltransferase family 39 protein, partial [Candidatus Lokiarchaeota archaeon]|nr:glycosyltransferase family 39 protein [Candidatus Lokiarchaeota archaeon]
MSDKKMKKKASKQKKEIVLKIFLMIIIVSGLINLLYLLSIPTDSKNAILLNYSLNRLLLMGFIFISMLVAFYLFQKIMKTSDKFVRDAETLFSLPYIEPLLTLFLVLTIIVCWLVPKNFQINPSYTARFQPLFIFISTIAICVYILRFFFQVRWKVSFSKTTIIVFSSISAFFLLILFLYPRINNGLWTDSSSVPLLATQVLGVWLALTIMKQFNYEIFSKVPHFILKNLDKVIFLLIWICAAFLWIKQPIIFHEGWFVTFLGQHIKPFPPNFEIYPNADSSTYFALSESIVIGTGIFRSLDKSLFLTFEGLNNWLAGGFFERMLNFQVVILSLFPPVLYLIGKEIHSRSGGLLAAVLAVFQEINAIQVMSDFPITSSKMLLSEPFMQLWTGLITLTAVLAFKSSVKKQARLFLVCGSVLGLSALFRLNTLVIIPFLLLFILINFFKNKTALLKNSYFFIIGIILALSPWMIHNAVKYNDPLMFIRGKGQVLDNRYEKSTSQIYPFDNYPDQSQALISVSSNPSNTKNNNSPLLFAFSIISRGAGLINFEAHSTIKSISDAQSPIISLPVNLGISYERFSELSSAILKHFLNNIIASFSIFPTSMNPMTQHFWRGYSGTDLYEGINILFLIFNLLTIATGVKVAVDRHKLIGLIPIGVFFGYHLSNGFAIASGNRYAQPVSWILLFYYSLGLITYCQYFIIRKKESKVRREVISNKINIHYNMIKQTYFFGLVILLILGIGSAPVVADLLPVNRFPKMKNEEIVVKMLENPGCQKEILDAGFLNTQEFFEQLKDKGYYASIGRVFSPLKLDNEEFNL